ncbi:actin-related protein [Pluteus cervinus]|uniref:Actin-related protein n=1 Tax=Pluteus cervinus TaxID=181527 RepID=A0ACD3BBD1_9AGAR|nr:actin-related protein [Pluteus cervinus]
MAYRDANIVIIETGRTVIRAGLGLHELLKTPAVEFLARVGLRRSATSEFIDGRAEGRGVRPWKNRISLLPQVYDPKAQPHDYLVGVQLDEALAAGQDIVISWPFADGDVWNYTQAEAIWKHVIFKQLQRRRTQNESPVLHTISAGISRSVHESICQVFFERFNVAGYAVIEKPLAQLYAANSLSGVVVDIGLEKTDITPIYEGYIGHSNCVTIHIGVQDCQLYLAHLLRSNQSVVSALSPAGAPVDPATLQENLIALVKQIWEDGHVKVPSDGETAAPEDEGVTDIAAVLVAGKEKAVIESGMKKKATAKASAAEQARAREIEALDLITIQFRNHSITLGKERHRFCEPLFDPSLLEGLTGFAPRPADRKPLPLQDAVGFSVNQADIDHRQYIWAGLFVTGDITKSVKGVAIALQSRLSPFLSNPDLQTDLQARAIRVLTVPEYYPEYRDTGNGYAAFLGSSITAKIIFNDNASKSYVTKADYTTRGPHCIIEMAPTLL